MPYVLRPVVHVLLYCLGALAIVALANDPAVDGDPALAIAAYAIVLVVAHCGGWLLARLRLDPPIGVPRIYPGPSIPVIYPGENATCAPVALADVIDAALVGGEISSEWLIEPDPTLRGAWRRWRYRLVGRWLVGTRFAGKPKVEIAGTRVPAGRE